MVGVSGRCSGGREEGSGDSTTAWDCWVAVVAAAVVVVVLVVEFGREVWPFAPPEVEEVVAGAWRPEALWWREM